MKKLFLFISLLFVSSSVFAACIKGNCVNGFGTYTERFWDKTQKKINFNFPQGEKEKDEDVDWSSNYGDSDYVGYFKDGKFEGQGNLSYFHHNAYIGSRQNTVDNPSAKYVGEFKDGLFEGQGTFIHFNGDKIEEKYVGEFKDGLFEGQGTYTFVIGSKYVGEFKDGNRNGQGTFTYFTGSKYVGEFKNNTYDGQGTFTHADGRIDKGIWKNNELVEEKLIIEPFSKPEF